MRHSALRPLALCAVPAVALALLVDGTAPGSTAGPGSAYTPLSPHRLLDTRISADPLGPGAVLQLRVTGVDTVPPTATAVVLNVTATGATAGTYLSVYPAGDTAPGVSSLNVAAHETVANLTVVPVGSGGQVSIFNASGSVQAVVDLEGYFAPPASSGAGGYVPLPPARIVDTRSGSGNPYSGHPLTPGGSLTAQVAGRGGVPVAGAEAVAINVTVTDPTAGSFLTVYPAGVARPTASNLNWWAGDTLANRAIVPLGSRGEVSFFNDLGTLQLAVDVVGYFTTGSSSSPLASLYQPLTPTRAIDTRIDAGTLQPGSFLREQFAGVDGISPGADAVVANLTAVDATAGSFFSMVPEESPPATSDLNFARGQILPNLVITPLSSTGQASIYNAQGTADALVDVLGYFEPESSVVSSPAPACVSASLAIGQGTVTQGAAVPVAAAASCPSGVQPVYEYWYKPWYSSVWLPAQGWTPSPTFSYATSGWTLGTYDLAVWVSSSGTYQSAAATAHTIVAPTYQWAAHTIPPEPTLLSLLLSSANAGQVAGCYQAWTQGRSCAVNGAPGQCTLWAEVSWASPYAGQVAGDASRLPTSYTVLTGLPPDTTPSVGALAVWGGPGPLAGSSAGHVGIVTAVAADGSSYTVSQMNWSDLGWDISTMVVPFSPAANATLMLLGFLPA